MDTTPAPISIDRQGQPDGRRPNLDHTHKRATCDVHADCVAYQRRKAARAVAPREVGERIGGLKSQVDAVTLLVGNSGNVEDLEQWLAFYAHVEQKVGEAVRIMRTSNPPQRDGSGASWQRIAAAAGMRKQSAWEKWGR